MKTWLNGQAADHLSLFDRGLSYGDGLFETIQIRNAQPLLMDAHMQRMRDGAQRLRFPSESIDLLIDDLAQRELPDTGVLKLTLTRGPGGRGYRLPSPTEVSRIIAIGPLSEFPGNPADKGVAVRLCETRLGLNPLLAGIKHLNRLEQVLARAEWDTPDYAEGVVCDIEGFLVEGTMSNLCWIQGGKLYTPRLDRAGVEGVVRNRLLVLASGLGIGVEQGRYLPEQLEQADELFICNSLIDIWPIVRLNEQSFTVGPLTRQLQQFLQREYQG